MLEAYMKKLFTVLILALLVGCTDDNTVQNIIENNYDDLKENESMIIKTESVEISISRFPEPSFDGIQIVDKFPLENWDTEFSKYDYRSKDLSQLDLSMEAEKMQMIEFDSRTIWTEKLPVGYNPDEIISINMSPGLGLKELHESGVDGTGVRVGIIDYPLLVNHDEYKGNIIHYEDINRAEMNAHMHGNAVTSVLVGKNVGVAPKSEVVYIAAECGEYESNRFSYDYTIYASAIDRIVEINETLDEKIRVISISLGLSAGYKGYDDILESIKNAENKGIFVITVSSDRTHNINFSGMGKSVYGSPDQFDVYTYGNYWAHNTDQNRNDTLVMIPMDSKVLASPTGNSDYVFYRTGGMSWSVPYVAGLYALCSQVDPSITPDKFRELMVKSCVKVDFDKNSDIENYYNVIDPKLLIKNLMKTR